MHNEGTGGGGGQEARASLQTTEKVTLVCAVSFSRCEPPLTETSKFRLKRFGNGGKKLVDGSITEKVNRR